MRFIFILIPIIFLLSGCGTVQKKFKSVGNVSNFEGEYLGNNFYYYDKKSLLQLLNTKPDYHGSVNKIFDTKRFRQLLIDTGFAKKIDKSHSLSKLDELNYNLKTSNLKLFITSFSHNSNTNENILGAKIEFTSYFTWENQKKSITYYYNFIVTYKDNKLSNLYYYHNNSSYNQGDTIISKNGSSAWLTANSESYLINLEKKLTTKLPKTKYTQYTFQRWAFDPTGRYFALVTHKDKNRGLLLYDILKNKMIINNSDNSAKGSITIDFTFVKNKYFIYKTPTSTINVYDLELNKVIDTFGTNLTNYRNTTNIDSTQKFVFANINGYDKNNSTAKYKIFIYDLDNKEIFCKIDNLLFDNISLYNNTIQVHNFDGHNLDIYNFEKNNCFKLGSYSTGYNPFTYKKRNFRYIKNNLVYTFENGTISTQQLYKFQYSKEDIEAISKLQNIKRLITAGFKNKGIEKIKSMILNDSYDYYANQYNWISNNLEKELKSLVDLTAFKRYLSKDIKNQNLEFTAKSYIFSASRFGYKDVILPVIKAYKKAIGSNASKYQREMLSFFQATYLADIGKIDEAYDSLLSITPLDKKTIDSIKIYSDWSFGLTKNRKKLALILNVDESTFNTLEVKVIAPLTFYDFNGNLIKKDSNTINIPSLKQEKTNQNSVEKIELLD